MPILGGHLQHSTSNQSPGPTKSHGFNTIFCIKGSEINKKQNPKYWQKLKLLTTANSGSNPADTSKEKDGNWRQAAQNIASLQHGTTALGTKRSQRVQVPTVFQANKATSNIPTIVRCSKLSSTIKEVASQHASVQHTQRRGTTKWTHHITHCTGSAGKSAKFPANGEIL